MTKIVGWRLYHQRERTWTCKMNHTYVSKYLLQQSREVGISKPVLCYVQYLQEICWKKVSVFKILTRHTCSFWLLCFLDCRNRNIIKKEWRRIQCSITYSAISWFSLISQFLPHSYIAFFGSISIIKNNQ